MIQSNVHAPPSTPTCICVMNSEMCHNDLNPQEVLEWDGMHSNIDQET